ncbi:hypothetical protein CEXT_491961 [Caerostris extrusa]|uniref:Uncharacterized protein n=1 Tax=Caerostris extrusa TaxID=172846 RepID=A0AAV4N3D7_CAEEX|nr:hypothetical protein CEXT_491961 [Caerostris extrusa]
MPTNDSGTLSAQHIPLDPPSLIRGDKTLRLRIVKREGKVHYAVAVTRSSLTRVQGIARCKTNFQCTNNAGRKEAISFSYEWKSQLR